MRYQIIDTENIEQNCDGFSAEPYKKPRTLTEQEAIEFLSGFYYQGYNDGVEEHVQGFDGIGFIKYLQSVQ